MQVERVKRYGGAGYPDKPEAEGDPNLLKALPKRWHNKPVVLAALSSLIGCSAAYQSQLGPPQGKARPISLVAPLFIHGEGHATFGCRAVNPPVFLSEEEAREVVIEEAKKAGIQFKVGGPVIPGVEVPKRSMKDPFGKATLVADGFDANRSIAFVVVSEKDADQWTKPDGSTVDYFDAKALAGEVVAKMGKTKRKGVVGTFYEPFVSPERKGGSWDQARSKALLQSREELRKQVRDFVQWLKTQGVI